jgi:uncharacterized protein with beta-barrel porin domain
MNRIYRLVWNRQQGKFVVAQENAASCGKGGRVGALIGKRAKKSAMAALAIAAALLAVPSMAADHLVTSTTDDGTGGTSNTLSWAINQANAGSGDTITIASSVTVTGTLPSITKTVAFITNAGTTVQITGATLDLSGPTANASIGNNIRFQGSNGGNGANGSSGAGGTGGSGSIGISGNSFTLTNTGTTNGGSGGNGGNGANSSSGVGGTGGSGSIGISGNSFTLTNTGTINGGSGGNGGNGGIIFGNSTAKGGNGGNGSIGVSGNSFTLTNTGTINGGNGGVGGVGGVGSVAGKGGTGVSGSSFSLTNIGIIKGGDAASSGTGNSGGNAVSGSGFILTNTGTLQSGTDSGFTGIFTAAVVSTGNSTIYNSGVITAGAPANAVELSGGNNRLVLLVGGQIDQNVVSNGGDTLSLGGASGAGSFALSDIGVSAKYRGFTTYIKENTGTWTLTGTNTGTSNWTAQGGSLVLADSMNLTGSLAVQNGATISANNANVSGTVTNAGTFGVTAGKTANTGAYTNSAGGTLRIGVADMSNYGKLVVNGTATLGGALFVDAASASGISAGTLSQIISATSISGTFATTSTNSLLFTYTPNYVGNQVNLVVAAASSGAGSSPGTSVFKSTTAQGNVPAAGAANALDNILAANPNGPIATLFQGFTTGQERKLSDAVSQTLPVLVGGSQVAANSAFSGINRVVQARVDGNRGLSSGDGFLGDSNVWVKPFGSWANQGARNGVSGFNASTYGAVAGLDRAFSDRVRAGMAFAYARSTVDSNSSVAPQSNKVDVYQLIGYGSYSLDQNTELNFQGDLGRNSNRGKRSIAFTSSVAEGAYDSTSAHVGAGIARNFALSEVTTFTPGVRADYTWVRDAGYAESGAGALNLQVNSRSAAQFVLSSDAKLNLQINPNTNIAFNAGLGYDTINKQASITSAYAGAPGASFVTYGLEQSPWIGRVGAGLSYTTSGGVDLSLRYDLEARSSFTNQTASAKARWHF